MRKFIAFTAVAALVAGYAAYVFLAQPTPQVAAKASQGSNPEQSVLGNKRPDYTLKDLEGNPRSANEWDGKVVLVNFWATWCPPCLREIPGFIEARKKYDEKGFEIVGIAIDQPKAVARFVKEHHVTYPILHGQGDATQVSRDYGDDIGALPFSALIDRDGVIRFTHAGEFPAPDLEKLLLKLL